MPIQNIPSVMEHGILSNERCAKLHHADVSMVEIQERRDQKKVPGGLKLHKYANLYFDSRNPMMYKRKEQVEALCVLRVSVDVLELDGTVIADRNASSDYVSFLSPAFINSLDFVKIYAADWRHEDRIEYLIHRSIKCAEVLVPDHIDFNYIIGAYVANNNVKNLLINKGFNLEIMVKPNIFFL